MRVLRFLFLAWMGVRTFAQPAPLLYELTNQQQIPGDQIVSLTPQGVRFRIQFQPTDVIPWGALTTNSVQHILGRLQREPVYLQLQPALQAAVFSAIQQRLRPASPIIPGVQPVAPTPGATNTVSVGIGLPAAPPDEQPVRPSLAPLAPSSWRNMPKGFVPQSGKSINKQGLAGSLFGSPIMLFFLLLLLGANFYLAREIADCKGRPRGLVCGLSFVAPFVVPLVFVMMPMTAGKAAIVGPRSRVAEAAEKAKTRSMETAAKPAPAARKPNPKPPPEAQPEAQSQPEQPVVNGYYHRSQVKFNRNFFVTELMRFSRAVPVGEWMVVRTIAGEEMWAARVTAVNEEGVAFSVAAGEIWADKALAYHQINEIFIQPMEG